MKSTAPSTISTMHTLDSAQTGQVNLRMHRQLRITPIDTLRPRRTTLLEHGSSLRHYLSVSGQFCFDTNTTGAFTASSGAGGQSVFVRGLPLVLLILPLLFMAASAQDN